MHKLKLGALVWCLFASVLTDPQDSEGDPPRCGYESCHPTKDGFINVHIVPHTHDDVGWLKTVDQYYYGEKNRIQNAGVQYILDSVMSALRENHDRRFIYVETAFLWKWWMQQSDAIKHQVQRYVRNGQLEIIGGAWSMNDEATTHYHSIIDQFTWGLRKLNDTFGECGRPKIGWQIDPFGHSREMASIFAQLGYDGILLGRIDYQDKRYRFQTKTPEFIWDTNDFLDNSKIFTSVMYNTYSPPPGFCFDILCADDPIVDDKYSFDYNVDSRVNAFFDYLANVTEVYTTNHVIITMGEDFNFQAAHAWFKNLDKLILYANQRQKNGSKYNLIYSTPSCYLKAVQESAKAKQISWSIKNDDFFPYASDEHSYWTGYFTSRPTLKRFERLGNNFLQVCKQLYALADLGPEDWGDLNVLREAMGVMQHHDAITGTEKQHVAFDYARLLSRGFDECQLIAARALSSLATGKKHVHECKHSPPEIDYKSCLLANISQCKITEELEKFVVTIYNPLSRNVDYHVRLPVTGRAYRVYNFNGTSIPTQLLPIAQTILNIPGRESSATVELIFVAEDIPPLGYLSFYVSRVSGDFVIKPRRMLRPSQEYHKINPEIHINPVTGKLDHIIMNNVHMRFEQDFLFYRGAVGNNTSASRRSSGAYIFRPRDKAAIQVAKTATYEVYEGPIVSEVRQVFNDWTSQIMRTYKTEPFLEFDWLIGPLPENDIGGREVITRFDTILHNNGTFYTDSNSRQMLPRLRNYRPTWDVKLLEDVAGNYYPVTSRIALLDDYKNLEVAILTDRAQGGASLEDGQLELMIHRNCLHDDAFGVGEALNEKAYGKGLVVRGSHYLIAGLATGFADERGNTLAYQEHDVIQRILLKAWTFISDPKSLSYGDYKKQYKMKYSGLKNYLPQNVQILTFEPWQGNTFLFRLEHVFEPEEDANLSKEVTVNLKNLFSAFDVKWYKETTLGANQWLDDKEKYQKPNDSQWEAETVRGSHLGSNEIYTVFSESQRHNVQPDFSITLQPMQIRTFIIELEWKPLHL